MKCLYLLLSLTEDGYVDTVTTHSTVQMVPLPCLLCVECQSQYFGISLTLCLLGCLKTLINIKALFNYCVLLEDML